MSNDDAKKQTVNEIPLKYKSPRDVRDIVEDMTADLGSLADLLYVLAEKLDDREGSALFVVSDYVKTLEARAETALDLLMKG